MFLSGSSTPDLKIFKEICQIWAMWAVTAIFVAGQFLQLSLSVYTTSRKLPSRTPIVVSAITTGLCITIATIVIGLCLLLVGMEGTRTGNLASGVRMFSIFFVSWIAWGIVFYRFYRDAPDALTRAFSWLFRGCAGVAGRGALPCLCTPRNDGCAPGVTAFGIASGIAIMLISCGPSVLLLFQEEDREIFRCRTGSEVRVESPILLCPNPRRNL